MLGVADPFLLGFGFARLGELLDIRGEITAISFFA